MPKNGQQPRSRGVDGIKYIEGQIFALDTVVVKTHDTTQIPTSPLQEKTPLPSTHKDNIGLDARKPVFGGLRTASAQSDQSLCYSLSGEHST